MSAMGQSPLAIRPQLGPLSAVAPARRRMCPLYVTGLIGPGDRKSVRPMAEQLAPGDYDQLHHFVAAGVWDAAPLEMELLVQADKLVGDSDAVLHVPASAGIPLHANDSPAKQRSGTAIAIAPVVLAIFAAAGGVRSIELIVESRRLAFAQVQVV
jgi:DDE superfamily endonuclease